MRPHLGGKPLRSGFPPAHPSARVGRTGLKSKKGFVMDAQNHLIVSILRLTILFPKAKVVGIIMKTFNYYVAIVIGHAATDRWGCWWIKSANAKGRRAKLTISD